MCHLIHGLCCVAGGSAATGPAGLPNDKVCGSAYGHPYMALIMSTQMCLDPSEACGTAIRPKGPAAYDPRTGARGTAGNGKYTTMMPLEVTERTLYYFKVAAQGYTGNTGVLAVRIYSTNSRQAPPPPPPGSITGSGDWFWDEQFSCDAHGILSQFDRCANSRTPVAFASAPRIVVDDQQDLIRSAVSKLSSTVTGSTQSLLQGITSLPKISGRSCVGSGIFSVCGSWSVSVTITRLALPGFTLGAGGLRAFCADQDNNVDGYFGGYLDMDLGEPTATVRASASGSIGPISLSDSATVTVKMKAVGRCRPRFSLTMKGSTSGACVPSEVKIVDKSLGWDIPEVDDVSIGIDSWLGSKIGSTVNVDSIAKKEIQSYINGNWDKLMNTYVEDKMGSSFSLDSFIDGATGLLPPITCPCVDVLLPGKGDLPSGLEGIFKQCTSDNDCATKTHTCVYVFVAKFCIPDKCDTDKDCENGLTCQDITGLASQLPAVVTTLKLSHACVSDSVTPQASTTTEVTTKNPTLKQTTKVGTTTATTAKTTPATAKTTTTTKTITTTPFTCQLGQFVRQRQCVPCAAGTYQDVDGSTVSVHLLSRLGTVC